MRREGILIQNVVERLFNDSVAGEEQPPRRLIPDRKGEHPVELLETVVAPFQKACRRVRVARPLPKRPGDRADSGAARTLSFSFREVWVNWISGSAPNVVGSTNPHSVAVGMILDKWDLLEENVPRDTRRSDHLSNLEGKSRLVFNIRFNIFGGAADTENETQWKRSRLFSVGLRARI